MWAGDREPFKPVNIGSNLARWESFDWDRHPKLTAAKRVIVDWYNDLPGSGALVLAGDVGCGKTHIADAIADLYGRWRVAYYGEVELIKAIQSTYGGQKGHTEESILAEYFQRDMLILDDLGTYSTDNAGWLTNIYARIFNQYMTVMKRPVLITTNWSMLGTVDPEDASDKPAPDSIAARIGVRQFSRLCDGLGTLEQGRYVDLFGIPDFRVAKYLGGV